jgi:hypothetical protein
MQLSPNSPTNLSVVIKLRRRQKIGNRFKLPTALSFIGLAPQYITT